MKNSYFLTKDEINELREDSKKASKLARNLFKEATKLENLGVKAHDQFKKANKN
ncbi:hypothetical protein ACT41M_06070 [Acinetobacter baumannii]|nr:hypothetical protein [Acinetobacter baumannii]MDC5155999.1 hypothetical protein [Acinetobacter baumannii]MDC5532004.1 hypothetical protein [Acinetobacter baumannii]